LFDECNDISRRHSQARRGSGHNFGEYIELATDNGTVRRVDDNVCLVCGYDRCGNAVMQRVEIRHIRIARCRIVVIANETRERCWHAAWSSAVPPQNRQCGRRYVLRPTTPSTSAGKTQSLIVVILDQRKPANSS